MNSPLVNYTNTNHNNYTKGRNHKIDTVTIHCTAGSKNSTAKSVCDYLANGSRKASANYIVGGDGSIACNVNECDRSWCTSSASNDNRAVTIEVASDNFEPYEITIMALDSLIELLVDICKRNSIPKLIWSDDKNDRVNHINGTNMTCHRDYAAKSCPGDYIYSLEDCIATQVNAKLENNSIEEVEKVENLTPIMGISVVPWSFLRKFIIDKCPDGYDDLAGYYKQCEDAFGVRADVAVAQCMLETGYLTFKGYCRPEWNNFAGLGATDVNANANVGIFGSHFAGVVAQCQHLFAYACTDNFFIKAPNWVLVDNRFNLVSRGCAPYVEWLGQKENPSGKGWATGKDYGYKIVKILNTIIDAYNEYVDNNSSQDETAEQVDDLSKRCDVSDYEVQVNPTKIYIYSEPSDNSNIVKTIRRGKYVIIEEQNGFGLLDTKEGWLQLSLCSYVRDLE